MRDEGDAMHSEKVARAITAVRAALDGSTPADRADLLEGSVRAIYEHVKFRDPEGGASTVVMGRRD